MTQRYCFGFVSLIYYVAILSLHYKIGFESFLGYTNSCLVAKHTLWTSDFITQIVSN